MSREVQAVTLLIIGVVLGHLTLTNAYLEFVKSTLWLPLLASAAVLIALGLLSLVRDHEDDLAPDDPDADATDRTIADGVGIPIPISLTTGEGPIAWRTPASTTISAPRSGTSTGADRGGDGPGDDHDGAAHGHPHDHARAPRIGMLVLVPILALLLVAPQALGAHAAGRGGSNRVAEPVLQLSPLPEPVDGAVQLTLGDTVVRALFEPDGPLPGTPVRLTGFVVRDDTTPGYRLSRFSVSCCAADASVRQILITEGSPALEEDTWVEVVATFEGAIHDPDGDGGATGIPVFRLLDEQEIERPMNPYEY